LQEIKVKKPIYRTSWSIDLQKFSFSDQKKRDEIKKEFKLNDKLIFITVTQLIPRKGIINLLKAWNELLQEIQEKISLIVIGNGPQKNYIEEFVKQNKIPNMHLLGQKPYEEVIQYYHSSDIFILPTLEDLFSLVVMEAMACGLPVLTTIYNGARELIREGENGYIFDSANIEDIKKVLVKVYKNRDKLKKMGSVSLEIIKDYSHEKVMKNLKIILEQI
jgi:glycosyltransferase involved in cell wall biosynthesis